LPSLPAYPTFQPQDHEQQQLESSSSSRVQQYIREGTRAVGQKCLMKFIRAGHKKRDSDRQRVTANIAA
jgi:hypothetical protein